MSTIIRFNICEKQPLCICHMKTIEPRAVRHGGLPYSTIYAYFCSYYWHKRTVKLHFKGLLGCKDAVISLW